MGIPKSQREEQIYLELNKNKFTGDRDRTFDNESHSANSKYFWKEMRGWTEE